MARFHEPTLKRLPMLEPRRRAMETCVYCPKLCRSACPVSNAEPRETIIPWGKVSSAYHLARGVVPASDSASFAKTAWACTGCRACAEACDHKNDVAGTLLDARDAFVREKIAPESATRAIAHFAEHTARTARAVDSLHDTRISTGKSLLIGCTYARKLPDVARDAIAVAQRLFGEVTLERACCGLPLRLAGDAKGFADHAARFANRDVVVVDPGCAIALRAANARVTLLVEHVAERVSELREASCGERTVRYHDPCQLGRGLGVYEAPRVVLTRVLGRAPLELANSRERGSCSGAGGLLPLTMPETSRAIAKGVVAEHDALGGGEIVTACASSALRLGATDLVTLMARAL